MRMNTLTIMRHFQMQERNFANFGTQPAKTGTPFCLKPKKNTNNLKTNKMEKLNKLQALCDASNKRYSAGLNDDDQTRAVFDYAKKNTSVCVIIGYDSYNAVPAEEVIKFCEQNPDAEIKIEKDFSFVKMNFGKAMILSKLLQ